MVNINNKKQGFTLIELLVVITIIGLLSTLAVFSLNSARMKARDVKRMSDLKVLSEAVEIYNIDNGEYPIRSGEYNEDWELYENNGCGLDGILLDSNGTMCYGFPLKNGSDIYLENIPTPPGDINIDQYGYGDNENPPCLWNTSLESGDQKRFMCKSGNCKKYNTNEEWMAFCEQVLP